VFVADDDAAMRHMLASALRKRGYEVLEARDGVELWSLIEADLECGVHAPGLVISDIRMPGMTGMEVLTELRRVNHSIPVVLTTAFGDEATHAAAEQLGADLVLDKPFDLADLHAIAHVLLGPRSTS